MPVATKAVAREENPLVIPSITLPRGMIIAIFGIAGNGRNAFTFSFSHPAVSAWTLPAGGAARVASVLNPDWDFAVQLAHGTSSGGTGDLTVTLAQGTAWRWIAGVWQAGGAPVEVVNAGQGSSNVLTQLTLPFTASGRRLALGFFDGSITRLDADFDEYVQQLTTEQYRVGIVAEGESGSTITIANYAYAGAAVGAVIPGGGGLVSAVPLFIGGALCL